MTTALDSNILFDILADDAHLSESWNVLVDAQSAGPLIISELVYAEVAAEFPNRTAIDEFLVDAGIAVVSSTREALHVAGTAWRTYTAKRVRGIECASCGQSNAPRCSRCDSRLARRQHMIADFVIGAHALTFAGRLLTRDKGYYRTYFPGLILA